MWDLFLFLKHTHTNTHIQLYVVICQGPRSEALEEMNAGMEKNQLWLRKTKRKVFYTAVACEEFRAGTESLLQVCVVMSYKTFLQPQLPPKKLMCNL